MPCAALRYANLCESVYGMWVRQRGGLPVTKQNAA